jgi:hypothetical protein
MHKHIRITIDEFGVGSTVIDGLDVSHLISPVVELRSGLGEGPHLTLCFMEPVEVDAKARVTVSEETVAALESLGWTPPKVTE